MPRLDLDAHGIVNTSTVHWHLSTPRLYEEAIARREARLAHLGPLVVRTGQHTGRSADDKLIVRSGAAADRVWWGAVNRPIATERFETLRSRLLAYLQGRELFVQDCFVGADPDYRVPVRVVTETAWHSLFARNMFLRASDAELATHVPQITVLHAPGFHAIPEVDGTHSEVFIVVELDRGLVLVGGTAYAGEIKKAVFTVMNYLLPSRDVLSAHCAANVGDRDDVALFFGLSGTGKTTLSTDPERRLIGDDELGWTDRGVFNHEGGCYAKVIRLSADDEPDIYQTTRRFGTILENVALDSATGRFDLDDASLTENTRAAYPLTHLARVVRDGTGPHPTDIFLLTADAFGVLPPIARLDAAQAVYHFLLGYTAKLAGTERGVVEPRATFSPCFGAPFMALSPSVYANLLAERIARHDARTWLVNTGWTGGPYGAGRRMTIAHTRALLRAAMSGMLDEVESRIDPQFGIRVPRSCPDVPAEILDPRATWRDPAAYDRRARELAAMFVRAFAEIGTGQLHVGRAAEPRVD
jgi:phosphoenolpyruvate carboxykinase (ATP)